MRVAVVGGGLAGLLGARALAAAGVGDIVVVEAADRPGGVVRTREDSGYLLEPGAGTMTFPHPHLSPLLSRVPVVPAAESARVRHVWTGGRLVTLRPGPGALLAPLTPATARLRALAEVFVRGSGGEDETIDDFLGRRLGRRAGAAAAWLAASGIYAGDPTTLSARAAFPSLVGMVERYGSLTTAVLARFRMGGERPRTFIPETSMASLADTLVSLLGDVFRAGHRVASIARTSEGFRLEGTDPIEAGRVVIACDPASAAKILPEPLAEVLRSAVAAPVAVVWLGGPSGAMPVPDGYGVLMGRDAETMTRGILLESSYAPHRAPEGSVLLKVIAGGAGVPRLPDTDGELVSLVLSEASRVFGRDLAPDFTSVFRHTPGIPQYQLGHRAWLARLEEGSPPGIHFTGWGYRGVGVGHLASDAVRLAGEVAP